MPEGGRAPPQDGRPLDSTIRSRGTPRLAAGEGNCAESRPPLAALASGTGSIGLCPEHLRSISSTGGQDAINALPSFHACTECCSKAQKQSRLAYTHPTEPMPEGGRAP